MKADKAAKLEKAGWKTGSAADFLELSAEEAAYIDLRLALSDAVKKRREAKQITQVELAKKLGSSQSRVAKMEAGDPSVALDLLIRTLLTLGATRRELSKVVAA